VLDSMIHLAYFFPLKVYIYIYAHVYDGVLNLETRETLTIFVITPFFRYPKIIESYMRIACTVSARI